MNHPVRVAGRLALFTAITGAGVLDHAWRLGRRGKRREAGACARWLQTWSLRSLPRIGIRFEYIGRVPDHGLIVSNHLSYLDIPLLAIAGPMVFVSKAEVRHWPFMGTLARCGGTLFLKREMRGHVAEIAESFRSIVEKGTVVTLFPEGTSSGGDTVLPFRSSLLEPAASHGWPVTPACIRYEVSEGSVSEDVAYWRDMTFFPHFLNLLARRWILGRVHFGSPVTGVRDRKELARRLQEKVLELKAGFTARDASGTCAAVPISRGDTGPARNSPGPG